MEASSVIIRSPAVTETESGLEINYPVLSAGWPESLWFKVAGLSAKAIDETLNAALLSLLIPAMSQRRSIILEGDVSCKLLLSCLHEVQHLLAKVLGLPPVEITYSSERVRTEGSANGISATGFSGGVDSYSILHDYYFTAKIPDQGRLSLLLFNNVGANGRTDELELYERRKKQAQTAANEVGLPLVVVNSNMDDFYVWNPELFFAHTHTLRNAAVAHLISNEVTSYRYASAFPFADCKVGKSNTIGHADPMLLPFLGSEWLNIEANGSQYSRADKLRIIADNPVVQKNLHVCVDHHSEGNCSKCQKCMRTMLILDLLGDLPKFDAVFDRKVYGAKKRAYLVKALARRDSFSRDIQRLHAHAGGKLGLSEKSQVAWIRWKGASKAVLKSLLSDINPR